MRSWYGALTLAGDLAPPTDVSVIVYCVSLPIPGIKVSPCRPPEKGTFHGRNLASETVRPTRGDTCSPLIPHR